jgi:hypothetical protein
VPNKNRKAMNERGDRGGHCLRTSQVGPLTGGNTTNFALEAEENVCTKQARLVLWDDIKDCPPKELKISPIAAIPHKSKVF